MNQSISLAAQAAFCSERLELTLFPTEKCQFRCVYCYEDFELGRMSPDVVSGIKNLISERSFDLKELFISWFGGEPLLAKDIIFEIMRHAQDVCSSSGCFVKGSMTTNADLLDISTLTDLRSVGVDHYQITLDGPEEYHDNTRRRINGKGTFASIWKNLESAKKSDLTFEILLRLHITPGNKDSALWFCRELCEFFLKDDSRFDILPMAVGDWGGPNAGEIEVVSRDEGNHLTCEARSIVSRYRHLSVEKRSKEVVQSLPTEVCYAAKPNAFLVRSNGDIAKCTVALNNKSNKIGHILRDGTIEIDQQKSRKWLRGWDKLDESILGCPLGDVISSEFMD